MKEIELKLTGNEARALFMAARHFDKIIPWERSGIQALEDAMDKLSGELWPIEQEAKDRLK